jgi:hypothetical protein
MSAIPLSILFKEIEISSDIFLVIIKFIEIYQSDKKARQLCVGDLH